jgi:hypothetical protein
LLILVSAHDVNSAGEIRGGEDKLISASATRNISKTAALDLTLGAFIGEKAPA